MSTNNADDKTEAPEQRGFEYRGRFYKLPGVDDFRAGDPALFNEATGLRWLDFLEAMVAIEDDEDPDALPDIDLTLVLDGMMAVAIWQANPRWRRDKALQFFQSMRKADIEMLMPEDDEEDSAQNEEEVPLQIPGAEPSSNSPSPSTNGSEEASETSSPSGSGTPASATGAT